MCLRWLEGGLGERVGCEVRDEREVEGRGMGRARGR